VWSLKSDEVRVEGIDAHRRHVGSIGMRVNAVIERDAFPCSQWYDGAVNQMMSNMLTGRDRSTTVARYEGVLFSYSFGAILGTKHSAFRHIQVSTKEEASMRKVFTTVP
jgi:hypothetical protein